MEQYNVTGMSCAACSARVEKAVGKVPGVENCSVSLLTNSMGVEGTATVDAVIAAVEEAGYGATLKSARNEGHGMNQSEQNCAEDALKDRETPIMKRRLIASLCFLIPLMYSSRGHMMWNWPLPGFLADKYDVSIEESRVRADLRCEGSLVNSLESTVTGYSSCNE